MNDKKKKCILVLGMHRSGTSALSGVLQLLGADLGKNLVKYKGEVNEKGFFENQSIYDVHEKILRRLDSSWDNLFPLPENWWRGDALRVDKNELKEIISNEFDGDLIAVKDPRLCKLFPIWKEVLEEMGIDYCCIIPLRNPLEIASSLKKRDGFSLEKSVLLWAVHILNAELFSRDCPRAFISFDQLLRKTGDTIVDFTRILNLQFPKQLSDRITDIEEFLSPNLKHYTVDSVDVENYILNDIIDLYRLLGLASRDKIQLNAIEKINDFRTKFFQIYNFFFNDGVIGDHNEKNSLLAQRDKKIAERDQEIIKRDYKIELLDKEIAARDQEIIKRDYKIEIMDKEAAARDQEIIKRDYKIELLDKEIAVRDQEIIKRDYKIELLDKEIAARDQEILERKN